MGVYVDTSALAKWYLPEAKSDEFEDWIRRADAPTISSLTLLEMRCLLARRRRVGDLDEEAETAVYELLLHDVDSRHLAVEAVVDTDVRAASHLLRRLGSHALRTLDTIHLSICVAREIHRIATADTVMAAAAPDLGIEVIRFT